MIAILVAAHFYAEKPEGAEEGHPHRQADEYHINFSLLSQAAKRLPVLDEHKVSQVSDWLERVAHSFEQITLERVDIISRLRHISEVCALNT